MSSQKVQASKHPRAVAVKTQHGRLLGYVITKKRGKAPVRQNGQWLCVGDQLTTTRDTPYTVVSVSNTLVVAKRAPQDIPLVDPGMNAMLFGPNHKVGLNY